MFWQQDENLVRFFIENHRIVNSDRVIYVQNTILEFWNDLILSIAFNQDNLDLYFN